MCLFDIPAMTQTRATPPEERRAWLRSLSVLESELRDSRGFTEEELPAEGGPPPKFRIATLLTAKSTNPTLTPDISHHK
ncbi:hypothetical protein COCON_G00163460 [Conger conger]|uniref:Uncharacterized protein n=1 Tax=Conger conger TaxID=82655 RepID=A0A9Q1D6K6_CONCO|nr:hypothetical protein COCON_G00163460 [Conger conger]